MKKMFLLSLFICFESQALFMPSPTAKEVVIEDTTHTLEVALNPQSVLCLRGDYAATSFKIAIPGINDITYLDHTSPGAPGPCINAGYCQKIEGEDVFGSLEDFRFPIFHDVTKPTETVQIRVVRKELLDLRFDNKCRRIYVEELSSTIRGTLFRHVAFMPLAEGPAEMCN